MHKIDIDKTAENIRQTLRKLGERPDANELLYTPEGIEAAVALTVWTLSLDGREIDGQQLISAASGLVVMPLANMLTSLGRDADPENVHRGVHALLDRINYDLHRMIAPGCENDPEVFGVDIEKRDVGDA